MPNYEITTQGKMITKGLVVVPGGDCTYRSDIAFEEFSADLKDLEDALRKEIWKEKDEL